MLWGEGGHFFFKWLDISQATELCKEFNIAFGKKRSDWQNSGILRLEDCLKLILL